MDSSSQCIICFEELSKDLLAAPCGHVFHSICIDKWKSIHPSCPICKAPVPAVLLRLFYTRDRNSNRRGIGASTKSNGGGVQGSSGTLQAPRNETGASSPDSEDVARLRAEVAANNKVLQISVEAIETYKNEIKSLTDENRAAKIDSAASRLALEAQLEEAEGKLKETKIELSKKHKEWFKLKREVDAKQKQLDAFKSERRTNEYIAQFAAQKSRVMNGLGQVSVEPIIEDVAKGVTRAEDVIRGQHELLSRNMDQQQRTLLILRKSKEECTAAVEELRAVRAECHFAKKNAVRCQRALAKEKSRGKGGKFPRASTEASAGDDLQRGRQGPGALSLPSGDDDGCISLDDDEDEDSRDDERGSRTWDACSSSAPGKRKRKLERQDGPSGGAGEKASGASSQDLNLASQKHRTCASRESPSGVGATRLEKALGMSVVGPAFTSIRGSSAGSGASAGAGAGAGAAVSMAKGSTKNLASSRGKYICTGYDAVGGRHSVRTPGFGGLSDALRRKPA